jgi:hypothetical protein
MSIFDNDITIALGLLVVVGVVLVIISLSYNSNGVNK